MHKYNPRGIIKWAPFNALSKYEQEITSLYDEFYKVDYTVSEDKYEYISELCHNALKNNEYVIVQIIEQNSLIEISGKISSVKKDYILLNNEKLLINKIYDIF